MGVLACGVGGLYRREIQAYLVVNQTDFDPKFVRVREIFLRERLKAMMSSLASSVGPTWQ